MSTKKNNNRINKKTKKLTKKNRSFTKKNNNKPYLTPKQILSLEFLAEYYDISKKARGLEKSTKSDEGFLSVWKKVNGNKNKLSKYPIKSQISNGQTWDKHREDYLNRRKSMIKNSSTDLYYISGPNKGLPTKLHVNMLMWGYSPQVNKVLSNIKKYKKIIKNIT
jgi:hypothetical protein